jgi:DNA-binding GntR family transcriptional regulator
LKVKIVAEAEAAAKLFDPVLARRLGDRVYQHIIEAIATNRLAQGAKIHEDEVAAQMRVSKTPVREALRRLEAEGFITVEPHRTPEVRRLKKSDIRDIYDVRESLERLAVRTVASLRPSAALAALESLQVSAETKLAVDAPLTITDSVAYNHEFHRLLFHGAGNTRLARLSQLIDVDVRRLSYLSVRVTGRQRDAVLQHRHILDAVKDGDRDVAEKLMAAHVSQARDDLLRQLSDRQDP